MHILFHSLLCLMSPDGIRAVPRATKHPLLAIAMLGTIPHCLGTKTTPHGNSACKTGRLERRFPQPCVETNSERVTAAFLLERQKLLRLHLAGFAHGR